MELSHIIKTQNRIKFLVFAVLIIGLYFFLHTSTRVIYTEEFVYPECSIIRDTEKMEPLITVKLNGWDEIFFPDWKMKEGTIMVLEDYSLKLWLWKQREGVDKVIKVCCFENPFTCKTTKTPY